MVAEVKIRIQLQCSHHHISPTSGVKLELLRFSYLPNLVLPLSCLVLTKLPNELNSTQFCWPHWLQRRCSDRFRLSKPLSPAFAKQVHFRLQAECSDNRGLWDFICAHVLCRSGQVEKWSKLRPTAVLVIYSSRITRGNSEADRLATEFWEPRQLEQDDAVSAAVATQVHIMLTLSIAKRQSEYKGPRVSSSLQVHRCPPNPSAWETACYADATAP